MKQLLTLKINGESHEVWTFAHKTLLEVLREDLGLTGTKHGCELGECGACTVLIDGEPRLSCLRLPIEVQGQEIETVEGISANGTPHPLQNAFVELGAAQCGYCTPGVLMSARALLKNNPEPDEQTVREALSGNLCRCTGYAKIIEAVQQAGKTISNTAGEAHG